MATVIKEIFIFSAELHLFCQINYLYERSSAYTNTQVFKVVQINYLVFTYFRWTQESSSKQLIWKKSSNYGANSKCHKLPLAIWLPVLSEIAF